MRILLILGLYAFSNASFGETAANIDYRHDPRIMLQKLSQTLQIYYIHNGEFPSNQSGLQALFENRDNNSDWRGPYAKEIDIIDKWGEEIKYKTTTEKTVITSTGPDKKIGTSDDLIVSVNIPKIHGGKHQNQKME